MEESRVDSQTLYLAKYGWTPKGMFIVIGCAAFTVGGFFMWSDNPLMAGLCIALFGLGGVAYLVGLLRGKLALRVDAEGVTLGRSPLVAEVSGRTVPWSDVEAVVLFTQITGRTTMTYVGLQRREGLAPLPGSPGARALKVSAALLPGIPVEVLATSIAVNGWRLDQKRLVRTMELVAPSVQLLDVRS